MTSIPCVPCCSVPLTTNIPGIQGNAGLDGADGISSYAILGQDPLAPPGTGLTPIPADGANTGSLVFSGPGTNPTAWMVVGQYVILGQGPGAALGNPGPYTFQIASIDSLTNATLTRRAAANDGASASVDVGAFLAPEGVPGINNVSAATTTAYSGFLLGNTVNVVVVANPLPIANGGTGQVTAQDADKAFGTTYRLLGSVLAANLNLVALTDIPISGLPSKYIVRRVVALNGSVDLSAGTLAGNAIWTGAGQTGTKVVFGQSLAALTGSSKWIDCTLDVTAGGPTTDILTATTLRFSYTTNYGGAATVDILIFGEDVS